MKTTHISYDFFYKNGEPYFHTFSIGIFEGAKTLFHTITSPDTCEYAFAEALKKVKEEGFIEGFKYEGEDGVTSVTYNKTIEG